MTIVGSGSTTPTERREISETTSNGRSDGRSTGRSNGRSRPLSAGENEQSPPEREQSEPGRLNRMVRIHRAEHGEPPGDLPITAGSGRNLIATVTSLPHTARPPARRCRRKGIAIRSNDTTTAPPPIPDPAELVALIEAHLAELNTHLALNTMALSAFGIDSPGIALLLADHDEECR